MAVRAPDFRNRKFQPSTYARLRDYHPRLPLLLNADPKSLFWSKTADGDSADERRVLDGVRSPRGGVGEHA